MVPRGAMPFFNPTKGVGIIISFINMTTIKPPSVNMSKVF